MITSLWKMFWYFEHFFWKYTEKTSRKSVSSVKTCGLIVMYIFAELWKQWQNSKNECWTAQTNTKCMLLHDKRSRAIITPSSPLRRTWLMEHFNRPIVIMINDMDSNDFQSCWVWLRNSIPIFKLVLLSLHHYDSRVTSHAKLRSHKLRDFTFP